MSAKVKNKKLIQIDLDGVLNTYCGNYNVENISPIKQGAKEFLEKLSKDYKIEIFTIQNKIKTVKWLEENGILKYIADVTNVKNQYASIFIDDRAINFDGNYSNLLAKIEIFKPHWQD